jgi:hypothetical protein
MKKSIFTPLEILANSWRKFVLSKLFLTGFAIICILGGLFLSSPVLALTVSPVKMELAGDPGTTIKGNLLLTNEQERTKTFYSSFESFEATGETGAPTFIPAEEGLVTWIETAPEITIEPKKEKKIPYTINIAAKIGILVLLRVSGEIEEGVGLLEFSTENEQKFFDALPINFTFRFKNSGGDRVKPAGEITIKNIFGKVSAVILANRTDGNVLSQSIRKFETVWEKIEETEADEKAPLDSEDVTGQGFFEELKREKDNFAFGRYTAELKLEAGAEKIQSSFSFFVIPWRILSLVILILALALFGFIIGIKKYNKWIIAKAKMQA